MSERIGLLTCFAILLMTAGLARAQSESTCTFDPAAALVTVSVDGVAARLHAVVSTGEIRLNSEPCGAATVFNTDSIQVNGSALSDRVSLSGAFAPGLTPEATGGSEIEISFALGDSFDEIVVNLRGGSDRLVFTSDGMDVNSDGDRDILTAGTARITVHGNGGNDRIDASAYASVFQPGTVIVLHGGPGRDILTGGRQAFNFLHGEDGNDVLYGGDSSDELFGGMGDDRMFGYGGNDRFRMEASADGADDMFGGDGIDRVEYVDRTNGVNVTIGDNLSPDGEPGEGDTIRDDIENVYGGRGPDVLVGNSVRNYLDGRSGDDELYGGGGDDALDGYQGNDIIVGDAGNDSLRGHNGNDFLDGGLGDDVLDGGLGRDILHGGPGQDRLDGGDHQDEFHGDDGDDVFINADGYAETVDCGDGPGDDPQPSALDTFISCEQI